MSLENDIQVLTAAVQALTAALAGKEVQPPEKSTKNSETKPAKTETAASSQSTAAPEPESGVPDTTFDSLAEQFRKLLKHDRPGAVALLEKLGAKKLSDLAEEQYAEVYGQINGLLP